MSPTRTSATIAGIRSIRDRFDAVLMDQWGTLHAGDAVFPAARDCVARLREAGKRIVILSNSGRRAAENERRLARLGMAREEYDLLLTSGEVAWRGLRGRTDPIFAPFRGACLPITRGADLGIVEGLGLRIVADAAAADFVLLAGLDDDRSDPDGWRGLLESAAHRHLPMLCTNPDLTMFTPGGLQPAPGALARRYESMGGTVVYVGKPHAPIFEAALAALGRPLPQRVLVIGDSLDHDVLGGHGAGMRTLLITGGVHARTLADAGGNADTLVALHRLAGSDERMPDWVMPNVQW